MTDFSSNTTVADGRTVVTTAGTRVQLSTSNARVGAVAIQAETDNTGVIVVGGSTVVASQATRRGIALSAGEVVSLDVDQLSDIYLDSTVNGDGVNYVVTSGV
jgi:hypothetical protein